MSGSLSMRKLKMIIREIFRDVIGENTQHEFKAVLNPDNPVKWAKTIVAYANGEGGILFVGVSDDGEAFGLSLEEIDRTKNLIAVTNDRHIFPHVKVQYMMRSVDNDAERFVLAVRVNSADSVVRYREGDFNETVYAKGDGYTSPATPEEIITLGKRKFGVDNETSTTKYCEDGWKEYISLAKEYREDFSAPTLKELQNEEAVTGDGYAKSGFLMFADSYSGDDSLICCRLWKGLDKTGTVLDSARLKGSLAKVLGETLTFIERNTKTGWRKTGKGGREEVRSYPKEAVREAVVNAIAHRDYSIAGTQIDVDIYDNRIDIVSPGSWLLPRPYDEYPLGEIPSIRRNSIIAAALDVANLMERGGTGFQTMAESYRACNPDLQPQVIIYPGFLKLRLFDRLYTAPDIPEYPENISPSEKIVEILRKEGSKGVKELQEATDYRSRSQFLKEVINPLIAAGTIYRDGKAKSPAVRIKLSPVKE